MKIRDIKFPIRIILLIFVAFFLSLGSANATDPNMPPPGGEHHDPCMPPPGGEHHDPNMPPPGGEHHDPNIPPPGGEHHDPNGHDDHTAHCEAMGMADGSPHVDPPQNVLDQVAAEYEANCQAGNCFLGEGNYQLLESMGHSREKVDCFLQAGEDHHNQ